MLAGIGPLLASFAAIDIANLARKLKRNAILYGFALIFLLTAYVLATAALAVYLGTLWGLPVGLLVVAGGALLLALIMYVSAVIANNAELRRKRELAAANSSRALMVTAAASTLPMVIKSRALLVVAIAGGLGFFAMKKMPAGMWLSRRRRPGEPID
jgi:ABC-type Na+ efflux pump permease subunit